MTNSRIGVCSWSLAAPDPRQLADLLATLEIDAVQLALVPAILEPRVWGSAVEVLSTAGIHIVSGMLAMIGEDYTSLDSIRRTGGVRPDATWPDNLKLAKQVARLAGEIDQSHRKASSKPSNTFDSVARKSSGARPGAPMNGRRSQPICAATRP